MTKLQTDPDIEIGDFIDELSDEALDRVEAAAVLFSHAKSCNGISRL
jgi:hypothetical protein